MVTVSQLYASAIDLLTNPAHTRWIVPVLLVLEALLCWLIITYVPYTEIDWTAYMEQISQYVAGERDYLQIKGGTGPLVYPGAHVLTYRALYEITDKGRDIALAQKIFAVVYLATLAVVMACYRQAKVPPYVFPMLVLSKRLHSIFVLRCFNDCFAVLFLWLAIYAYQHRQHTVGSLLYSWGLGTKMFLLLTLPGVGMVLFLTRGVETALRQILNMAQLQLVLALPFLKANGLGYLTRAFDLTRKFLFKWTVNWRFLGEDTFSSREFSVTLMIGHLTLLAVFALTRWLQPTKRPIREMLTRMTAFSEPLGDIRKQVSLRITPRFIMTTMLTANVIGMLFARSLHYQFYAYLAWSTPFLLWRSGLHPIIQYGLWAAQEWAWNVYPSTTLSSSVVVGVIAMTLAGVWIGTRNEEFPKAKSVFGPEGQWYIK